MTRFVLCTVGGFALSLAGYLLYIYSQVAKTGVIIGGLEVLAIFTFIVIAIFFFTIANRFHTKRFPHRL